MNKIYTDNGAVVIEMKVWAGINKFVKNIDGTYEVFAKGFMETELIKVGHGKRAKRNFDYAYQQLTKNSQ